MVTKNIKNSINKIVSTKVAKNKNKVNKPLTKKISEKPVKKIINKKESKDKKSMKEIKKVNNIKNKSIKNDKVPSKPTTKSKLEIKKPLIKETVKKPVKKDNTISNKKKTITMPSTTVKKPKANVKKLDIKVMTLKNKPKSTPIPEKVEYPANTLFVNEIVKLCEENKLSNNNIIFWNETYNNIANCGDDAEILRDFRKEPAKTLSKISTIIGANTKLILQEILNYKKLDRILLHTKFTNKYITWKDLNNYIRENGDDPIQYLVNQFLINDK